MVNNNDRPRGGHRGTGRPHPTAAAGAPPAVVPPGADQARAEEARAVARDAVNRAWLRVARAREAADRSRRRAERAQEATVAAARWRAGPPPQASALDTCAAGADGRGARSGT